MTFYSYISVSRNATKVVSDITALKLQYHQLTHIMVIRKVLFMSSTRLNVHIHIIYIPVCRGV